MGKKSLLYPREFMSVIISWHITGLCFIYLLLFFFGYFFHILSNMQKKQQQEG